jgi:hypothetical protein
LVSACQDIAFQTSVISDKFLTTIQQLQVKLLASNFIQGSTMVKLFEHLQLKAQSGNMNVLISASSDLFQIDVSYFYKSSTMELNIFLHVPVVKLVKLLKFFQLIKFSLSKSTGQNFWMMPNIDQDLLAIGRDHQFNLLSQSD